MKRVLVSVAMCLLLSAPSVAGGTVVAPVATALLSRYVHAIASSQGEGVYVTGKILRGETLRVAVEVPRYPEQKDEYEEYVQRLYDMWFSETIRIIRDPKYKRVEFNDLLVRLPQHVSIDFVSSADKYDLKFKFTTLQEVIKKCGDDPEVKGCVSYCYDPIVVFVSDEIAAKPGKINRDHLHEVGHTLGLADQYYSGRNKNADVNYASPVRQKSVMNIDGPAYIKEITPDDADGVVLAADLALRNYNRGGEKGWKSLDPNSKLYYVHGKVGNSPHSFYLTGKDNVTQVSFVEYDKKGIVTNKQVLGFAKEGLDVFTLPKTQGQPLLSDAHGRPLKQQGIDGVIIYTSYFYESIYKLAVNKNEEVVYYEESLFEDDKHKEIVSKDVYAGSAKGFIVLKGKYGYFMPKEEVSYQVYKWEGQHELFYEVVCTKKECEEKTKNLSKKNQTQGFNKSYLKDIFERGFLFETLKRLIVDKGTLKMK